MNPEYKDTNIAKRLERRTRRVPAVRAPAFLLAPLPLGYAAIDAFQKGDVATAKVLAGMALGALGLAIGLKEEPVRHEPLGDGAGGFWFADASIQLSKSALEREHFFIAETEKDELPVLGHESHMPMHMVVLGGTGAAKTSQAIIPALKQNLEMGDTSAGIFLFREDLATVAHIRKIAKDAGIRVKFFTTIRHYASALWNPFLDPAAFTATPAELAEVLSAAFGLQKGEAHGAGHFGSQNEGRMRELFALEEPSFRHYVAAMKDKHKRKLAGLTTRKLDVGSHTVALFERAAARGIANRVMWDGAPGSLWTNRITTDSLIDEPTIHICLMPTLISPTTPVMFARTMLYLTVLRLHQWPKSQPRVKRIIMCFDDAAPMMEASVRQIFSNSRGLGLALLIGVHSLSDFRNADIDLVPTIENSTAIKVFLTVNDKEGQDFLMRSSGETTRLLESSGETVSEGPTGPGGSVQRGKREIIVPRLTLEDIARVNHHPDLAIVCVSPPRHFAQVTGPAVVRLRRTVAPSEFHEFEGTPWPAPDGETTIREDDLPPPPPIEPTPDPEPDPKPDPPPPPQAVSPAATEGKRKKKKTKAPDPERQKRAESAQERWRKFASEDE